MSLLPDQVWKITAEATDTPVSADLLFFASIGDPWDPDSTLAKSFTEDLAKIPKSVKRLNLHINSPGGNPFDAQAIYSSLADHPSEKTVYIDGLAASAASLIAMVGHKTYIRAGGNLMIHLPRALAIGDVNAMRDTIHMLEACTEPMINVYQKKTGLEREELRALMEKETWFTPQEAVDKGFADEVRGVIRAAASLTNNRVIVNGVTFDLTPFNYQNVPRFPKAQVEPAQTNKPTMPRPRTTTTTSTAPPEPDPNEPTGGEPGSEPQQQQTQQQEPAAPAQAQNQEATPEEVEAFRRNDPRMFATVMACGIKQERERLIALEKFSHPACAAIVAKARANGQTAAEIAEACYETLATGNSNQSRANDRASDAAPLAQVAAGDAPRTKQKTNKEAAALLSQKIAARTGAGRNGRRQ